MLTERQKKILWAIVDDYIVSAEPVGSRTVSKKEGVGFSAATVRNEMADLEEMGFLEQPHTSAGRIPSQKGYRFYVDHLLTPHILQNEDVYVLHQCLTTRMDQLENMIKETSVLLSDLTNYMTLILGPKIDENRLKYLQIVPLSEKNAVVIMVTDTGHVQQHRIKIPEEFSTASLERLVNFLNHRLRGTPIFKLRQTMQQKLSDEFNYYVDQYEHTLRILEQVFSTDPEEQIFLSGTTHMLDQPEFQDLNKMRSLLTLVEKNQTMIELLEPSHQGVHVRIGTEIHMEGIDHFSMITASYVLDNEPIGTIGVLGPTRMDYGKVIGLIDFLAKDFSNRLRRLYNL